MTAQQQKLVEDNLGLVHKVIKDKLKFRSQIGIYTYDDLFQIGCIGLCKSAYTDKGGTFSTYAYRIIWNEICDALIYSNKRQRTETIEEDIQAQTAEPSSELKIDISAALDSAKRSASPCIVKGIESIIMMSQGYTCREIGRMYNSTDKQISAVISKARKYLRSREDIQQLISA